VAKALGNVGRQTDVRGSEAVFVVNVPIAQSPNGDDLAAFIRAVLANELGHRPGFEWRPTRTEFIREVPDHHADKFTLAVPEAGQQVPFFFGREQVGRECD